MSLHFVGSHCRKVCCVWKGSLPCPPPQDACCLFTPLSVVSYFIRKSLYADESSWSRRSLLFNCPLSGIFFVSGLAHSDGPELLSSEGNCFHVFLFACFGMTFPLIYHAARTKKQTNHNNHTLPQTVLRGLLFFKSGYTYVGSTEYSIDIYRK